MHMKRACGCKTLVAFNVNNEGVIFFTHYYSAEVFVFHNLFLIKLQELLFLYNGGGKTPQIYIYIFKYEAAILFYFFVFHI